MLFVVKPGGRVQVITANNNEPLRDAPPGDMVIALAKAGH